MRRIGLLFAFLFSTLVAFADGTVTGSVTDAKTNDPLIGVPVKVKGTATGVVTDVDGNFTLTLPAGIYEIEIAYIGYDAKIIEGVEVKDGESVTLNTALSETARSKNLDEIVVRSTLKKENINAMITFQRQTNTVAQVVSAEAIRRSPDRNTGEVLKRVSGASIQEGKYLVVRGLADRYNAATLNGALLTSSEPDRKTFSFDLFPANIIDNIVINKAAVPELPGEFAGGLVQVNTRDIPSENFFTIQLGTGGNTQTLGRDFARNNVGSRDWLGIDDGARALPEGFSGDKTAYASAELNKRAEMSKLFQNTWGYTMESAPLNIGGQATGGYVKKMGRGTLGFVGSLNYSKNNRRTLTSRDDFDADGTPINTYDDERFSQDIQWGGLANVAYSQGRSKISLKNLFNVSASNAVTLRQGTDIVNGPFDQRQYELSFISNRIFSSQLAGEHVLGFLANTKLRWNGNYTNLAQDIPDLRRLGYQTGVDLNTNQPDGAYTANVPQGSASINSAGRFFSDLNDNIYGGTVDASNGLKINDRQQTLKVGYLFQMRDRVFTPRALGYVATPNNPALPAILRSDISTIFAPENIASNALLIDETTNPFDAYEASSILNAGYVQLDNQVTNRLQITWGARVENYFQEVRYNDGRAEQSVDTMVTDILPSANIKYGLGEKSNLRLSGSQTVIRPEFRELAPFSFYNFDLLAVERGNPTLQRTKVTNADVRYEIYPTAGEFVTIGAFYKYFRNPIERFYNSTGGGSQTLAYQNVESAYSYGVEAEFRKSLGFIRPGANEDAFLNNLYVFSNVAYIRNRVQFEDGLTLKERPMQGQSDYVLNGGITGEIRKTGTNASLLVNRIGRRIFIVGDDNIQPHIWEAPRTLLDFQITQKFAENGEVRLAVTDIFNQYLRFYEDNDANGRYEEGTTDQLRFNTRFGRGISLSVAYKLPVKRKRPAESVTTP